MQIDVASHIGAVGRSVRSGHRDGQPVRTIVASRTYPTTLDDLWDAISNPVRIPRWFLPVTGDLRLGGRYQLEGNAGGEITQCDPPRHLAVTWEYGGGVSWLDVRLAADERGGTRLVLEHAAPDDEHWAQFGPGAGGVGWDLGLMGLALHIATGEAVDPEQGLAWLASAEGKSFVVRTSEAWSDAAVAAGEDAEAAKSAAARTLAVYTGESPAP